jgi:hypothetical protein
LALALLGSAAKSRGNREGERFERNLTRARSNERDLSLDK